MLHKSYTQSLLTTQCKKPVNADWKRTYESENTNC